MLEHTKQLTLNHGSTMDAMSQLAMGWCEILAVLEDRSFNAADDERGTKTKVLAMMQAYQREQQSANEQLG